MVKSSGVEKGELFVGVQIRQLVLPFPLEAPLCVPLRLSPSGSVALSHSSRCWYLILVQVVRCKLGCVHAPFASLPAGYTWWWNYSDSECVIFVTEILLSLISSGVQLITRTLRYYSVSCVVLDLFRIKTILLSVELYPGWDIRLRPEKASN